MRIVILTLGTRGDVQPYVALGCGLRAAGHSVRIASPAVFEDLVLQQGLEFSPVSFDGRIFLRAMTKRLQRGSARNMLRFVGRFGRLYLPLVSRTLHDYWQACQSAEAIIFPAFALGGLDIAEKLEVPACVADLQPRRASRHVPSMFFPRLSLGPTLTPLYNRSTYGIGGGLARGLIRPLQAPINRWRVEKLGLPPRSIGEFMRALIRVPTLYGISPTMFPQPQDWPAWAHVTGYWFLDERKHWQAPPELEAFLAAGPPPVSVGFGSMSGHDPAATTAIVIEALRRSGQRGLLLTGWGGLDRAAIPQSPVNGGSLFVLEAAPHDWLFPRVAAVIHHGGAGTTAAALRAGVPSSAVPMFFDQFYWGGMITKLGLGPPATPMKRLTVAGLADTITRVVREPCFRKTALSVAERIAAEDGVGTAVEMFHHHLSNRAHARS